MLPRIGIQDENESASASSGNSDDVEHEGVRSDGQRSSGRPRHDEMPLGVYEAGPIKKLHRH